MDNAGAISITGLVTMSGVGLFVNQAPKLTDLRRAHKDHDLDAVADLRVAEVTVTATMCLAGIALAAMTNSPAPAYLAIATSVVVVACYEWTLAQPGARTDDGSAAWAVPRTPAQPQVRPAAVGLAAHIGNAN